MDDRDADPGDIASHVDPFGTVASKVQYSGRALTAARGDEGPIGKTGWIILLFTTPRPCRPTETSPSIVGQ